jgi:hypothetical protein
MDSRAFLVTHIGVTEAEDKISERNPAGRLWWVSDFVAISLERRARV